MAWSLVLISLSGGVVPDQVWDFDDETDVSGAVNLVPSGVAQGFFCGMTRWDPYVYLGSRAEPIDAKAYPRMRLRMYSSATADVIAVYYRSPNGQWGLGNTLPVVEGWAVYSLDLNKAAWGECGGGDEARRWGGSTGKVSCLRIDPGNQSDRWIVIDYVKLDGDAGRPFEPGVAAEKPTAGTLVSMTAPGQVIAGNAMDFNVAVKLAAPLTGRSAGFFLLTQGDTVARFSGVAVEPGRTDLSLRASIATSLAAHPAEFGVRFGIPGVSVEKAGPNTNVAVVKLVNPRAGKVRPPVAAVKVVGGDAALVVDGKPVPAFLACAFDHGSIGRKQWYREFAESDLHLYSDWFGTSLAGSLGQVRAGVYEYSEFDTHFAEVLELDPQAFFLPHIGITAPQWWQEAHPEELCLYADGGRGPQSFASRRWHAEAAEDLTRLIRHLEGSPYADRILGYIIYSGYSAEWQSWGLWDDKLGDYSAPAVQAWRRWLRNKYGDDAALRKAWNDAAVKLETAAPPSPAERHQPASAALRDPVRERKSMDYYVFLGDTTADAIIHFAGVAKKACGGKSLVGTYYGYLTQHGRRQQDSSHLALAKVLRCPDVDFLMSPPLYTDRQLCGTSGFMSATESVRLHGKLWLSEADYRTHLSSQDSGYGRTATSDESRAVLLREMGNVLCRRAAVSWYDMAGNWLGSPELLADLRRMRDVQKQSLADRQPFHGDVAVFVDEESFACLRPMHGVNEQLVLQQIIALPRMGAAWDFYLLSDIGDPALPPHKLYLFLNAVNVGGEMRKAIRDRLRRDGATAVWVYASGFYNDGAWGPEQVAELTGIRVSQVSWGKPLWLGGDPSPAGSNVPMDPVFVVEDPKAESIALIRDLGKVGLARKPQDGWTSVFCSVPTITPDLLRQIARQAGCHVYLDTNDALAVDNRFICVHAATEGRKKLTFPSPVNLSDAMSGQPLGPAARQIDLTMKQGETRLLRY